MEEAVPDADSLAEVQRRAAEEAQRERDRLAGIERARTALTAMVFFEYDESTITAEGESILRDKVDVLRANPEVRMRVEGHADERGSTEYNIALGQRRADAVVRFLSGFGVDGSRFTTTSYGEERPLERGETEFSWSRNRRAEFAITAGESTIQPMNDR